MAEGQVLLSQVVKGLTVEHLSLLLGRWSLPRVVVRRTSHERNDSKASRDRMEQEEPESVWEGRTSHQDSRRRCSLDLGRDPLHQMSERQEQ
jgi:hypothetical protein